MVCVVARIHGAAAAARDAAALVEEMQAAGVIGGIDVGPARRLARMMLQEAWTPPFTANVIDKLSGISTTSFMASRFDCPLS